MSHLLYLMFRCDGDVMESLDFGVVFEGSKHTPGIKSKEQKGWRQTGAPKQRSSVGEGNEILLVSFGAVKRSSLWIVPAAADRI